MCRRAIYSNEKYTWLLENPTINDSFLDLAIMENDIVQVKKSLDNGARLKREEEEELDPIHRTILQDNVTLFKIFLEMGIDPHDDDDILFLFAIENDKREILKFLLKINVNIFTRDSIALNIAHTRGHEVITKLILEYSINKLDTRHAKFRPES